jgi:hypothetical protein
MRKKRPFVYIMLVAISMVFVAAYHKDYSSPVSTFDLSFKGTASGGSLILADTLNRTSRYILIQTLPGESAESVAQRLADKINECHSLAASTEPPHKFNPHRLWVGGFQAKASEGTIILPGPSGKYILAGTENSLGIPKPPLFLSCSYDKINDKIVLRWVNPPDGYDFILVNQYWTDRDHGGVKLISGKSTSFTFDRKKNNVDVNDFDVLVTGFRENIPSNAAAIHVSGGGYCQSETYGIPFANGLSPNWMAWSTAAKPDISAFEQGDKYANLPVYNPVRTIKTKPFYQVIKAPSQGASHGVYRKFLGLTPGHTYRLTACLSTLEMDSVTTDWSLSLHTAHNGPDGKDLTARQLTGLDALPDGRSGPEAGRIALYKQGKTTKGEFAIVSSDSSSVGEPPSPLITLPAGADTITVWIRFSCSDPKGKVGFSGVKLEDISANPNPKSLEQIKEEEFEEEARLIKRIERASRR